MSPANTSIRSGDTAEARAHELRERPCSLPWPIAANSAEQRDGAVGIDPEAAVSGFMGGVRPLPPPRCGLAIPSPRSAPRSRACARRFSKPGANRRRRAPGPCPGRSPHRWYVETSPVWKGRRRRRMTFSPGAHGSMPSRARPGRSGSMAYVASAVHAGSIGTVGWCSRRRRWSPRRWPASCAAGESRRHCWCPVPRFAA